MEKSTSIIELSKALLSFHKSIGKISKDAKNPFFKSKYASLSNIQDAIRQPLQDAGLTYTQLPESDNILTTILIHAETGEYLQSSYDIHPVKSDPQSLGSAITYARRYALGAILGLNIDDDDDGNAASQQQQRNDKQEEDKRQWLNPNTDKWTDAIAYLKGDGTMAGLEKGYKISKDNKAKLLQEIV